MNNNSDTNLPVDDSNSELERYSRNKFRDLWDTGKFIVRDEYQDDKGIDFIIELKKGHSVTNFRFNVQLKSTESIGRNQDGSISFSSIKTSNINYLMHPGLPAFYILYHKPTNVFYFERASDFENTLSSKDLNWQQQEKHTIRFNKLLDDKGMDEIYNTTSRFYQFIGKVSQTLAINTSIALQSNTVIIDSNLNITDDNAIKHLIESNGLNLINKAKWNDILSLHKKASGGVASSAKYNLVLALASYYTGQYFEALSFSKKAKFLIHELPNNLKNHLLFLDATLRFSIGYIDLKEYDRILNELQGTENVGFYVQLDKAKREYLRAGEVDIQKKFNSYSQKIQEIINNPNADETVVLNAKCELILAEGTQNNMEYLQGISMLNAVETSLLGPHAGLRKMYANRFIDMRNQWLNKVNDLQKQAIKSNNDFIFFNAIINRTKIEFELIIYSEYLFITLSSPGNINSTHSYNAAQANDLLHMISEATKYYQEINHIENSVVSLSIKYELLLYLKRTPEAEIVFNEMSTLVDNYELKEYKENIIALKNSGTTQDKFVKWNNDQADIANKKQEEYERMINEMREWDKKELKGERSYKNTFGLHLYPIGLFSFPKNQLNEVFEILNVSNDVKDKFLSVLNVKAMPVANIYHEKIIEEGYADGPARNNVIESWRNIYRIRKEFYNRKFFRIPTPPVKPEL